MRASRSDQSRLGSPQRLAPTADGDRGSCAMTRQEFIQSSRRHNYRVLLPGFSLLITMVVLPFAWVFLQVAHPDMPLALRLAGYAICIAVFVFAVWFVYLHSWRTEERQQHWCPHCKKRFGGTEDQVLRTGKCWYCGFQVIDDAA
jgi:hypothetical protein